MTPGGDHDLSRLAKAQNPGGVCARSPCMANPSGTGGPAAGAVVPPAVSRAWTGLSSAL